MPCLDDTFSRQSSLSSSPPVRPRTPVNPPEPPGPIRLRKLVNPPDPPGPTVGW